MNEFTIMGIIFIAIGLIVLLISYWYFSNQHTLNQCKIEGWNCAVETWKICKIIPIPENMPQHPKWRRECHKKFEEGFIEALEEIKKVEALSGKSKK